MKKRYGKSAETQTRILDAAEELFAKQGYEATTTRQITTAAGVRNASVNYYFATKQDLATAVIDRRFDLLRLDRDARLATVFEQANTAQDRLRKTIEAFVLPLAALCQTDEQGWQNYNRIMAQLAASGEWNQETYTQKINASALKFIGTFIEIFPNSSRSRAVKAYEYMLGSVLLAFAESSRGRKLIATELTPQSTSENPAPLLDFLEGGLFKILSQEDPCQTRSGP